MMRPLSCLSISCAGARHARNTTSRFASTHAAPLVEVDVRERLGEGEVGSVHQDVEPTKLARRRARPASSTSDSSAASMACAKPLRLSAQISLAQELASDFFARRARRRRDADVGARLRQGDGDGAADRVRGADHERGLAVEGELLAHHDTSCGQRDDRREAGGSVAAGEAAAVEDDDLSVHVRW